MRKRERSEGFVSCKPKLGSDLEGWGLDRAAINHPGGGLSGDLGDEIVVVVVVEQRQAGGFAGSRDHEVGNGNAVAARAGELGLDVDGTLENRLGDRDGVVSESPASPDAFVLFVIPGAEQHLQVDDGAGRGLSRFDDGSQPAAHRLERHPGQGALVNDIASLHERQALDITSGSARSMPRIVDRASTSSRRASARKTPRNASSIVSLRVAVESTSWTALNSSSLISTLVFRTPMGHLPPRGYHQQVDSDIHQLPGKMQRSLASGAEASRSDNTRTCWR